MLRHRQNAETLEGIFYGFCHCVDLVVDTVAKTLDFLAQLRHHLQESVELGGAYHGMTVLDDSTIRHGPDFISSARWETLIPIFGSLILFIFNVDLVFRFTPRISEFASGPIRNVPGTFLLFLWFFYVWSAVLTFFYRLWEIQSEVAVKADRHP